MQKGWIDWRVLTFNPRMEDAKPKPNGIVIDGSKVIDVQYNLRAAADVAAIGVGG